jgi:hypothetical protein
MAIQKRAGAGAGSGRAATPPAGMVSLKPSDQQQGGILDDVDVTFTECSFVEYDYNGKVDKPTLALKVVMNDGEADHVEYFSAGDLARFQPSEDGKYVVAVAGAKGLNSNSNCGIFLKSLVDMGFPEDRVTGKVDVFEGINAHVNRIAQPKRSGLQRTSEREPTVLVVTKIHKMPWDVAGKKTKTAPAPAVNGESTDDVTEEAIGVLLQVLEAKGGSVKRSGIAAASFKFLAGNANRAGILKLLTDDDFIGTEDMGWEYDGQTITSVS